MAPKSCPSQGQGCGALQCTSTSPGVWAALGTASKGSVPQREAGAGLATPQWQGAGCIGLKGSLGVSVGATANSMVREGGRLDGKAPASETSPHAARAPR